MTYKPPLKGFWKQISVLIIILFMIILSTIFINITIQKKSKTDLRQTKASGILVKKKDLRRGSFLIVIMDNGEKKEYDLAGYDSFYDKINLGDSIEKTQGSFYFQVFRKNNSNRFEFIHTIGYE